MTSYSGDKLFGDIRFGLYGYEDIDFEQSKEAIQFAFEKDYKKKISDTLEKYGMKLIKFEWWSPREYNFMTDSLDPEIEIVDKDKLLAAINDNADKIQASLDTNKSYDGFIATTAENVGEVMANIGNGRGLDLMALKALLSEIDFSDFDLDEHLVREEVCQKCGGELVQKGEDAVTVCSECGMINE